MIYRPGYAPLTWWENQLRKLNRRMYRPFYWFVSTIMVAIVVIKLISLFGGI